MSYDSHDATIVSLEGQMYPVEIAYLRESIADYVRMAAEVAWSINLQVRLSLSWVLIYLVLK